jgi:folylpolyglutamate synthase/dihydropteroate synthase
VVDDPAEAVRRAVAISGDDDLVFVTGSTYLVGAVRQVALTGD